MKKLFIFVLLVSGLFAGEIKVTDTNTTDLVYQLDLKKYPRFLCEAVLKNGKKIQFVSVKAMMQVYEHQDYFKKHKLLEDDIKELYVQDYLDGTRLNAKQAKYMFGSRIVGPHGDELIPLKDDTSAKLFKLKYGGTKLLPFEKINKGLIRYLDM